MPEPVLPPESEWESLAIQPGSITWRRSADLRLAATAGYALLLQVMHPVIGAGVKQFSDFRADPWGRLIRTTDFNNQLVYGGPESAAAIASRVRAMHKFIKGTLPDGGKYHALEPAAWAWVHISVVETFVTGHRLFGTPLSAEEVDTLYAEWRGLGRFLGIRWRDMPETWADFQVYFDDVVENTLVWTPSVDDVFATLAAPPPPPRAPWWVKQPLAWRAATLPLSRAQRILTIGLLPDVLADRLGLSLNAFEQAEFKALSVASRATTPMLPKGIRNDGPAYAKRRAGAMAKGRTASVEHSPHILVRAG
ncbi:MAG: DUF2236 domain-containing protein [Solirubrobacteraceae bacterium]|nr:DUF2236 domain-containing protein [Solirubrobacteraceae bacterium]